MRPSRPCMRGLPGRSATRQKPSVHALPRQRRLHEVVLADGGAAEGDEEIRARLARRLDPALEVVEAVAGDAEVDRLAPGARDERGERDEVGGDDLVGAGRLAGPDELVARGEDRDARPAADAQRAVPHGGGERQEPGVEALAGPEQGGAFREVEAARAHEAAGGDALADEHGVAVGLRVLLDDDRRRRPPAPARR